MTTYLRDFVQTVADVPSELRRHFEGLKELDLRVLELQRKVDDDCLTQLDAAAERQAEEAAAAPAPPKRQKGGGAAMAAAAARAGGGGAAGAQADAELARRIEQNMNKIITLSEEKMQRAQQIYDYVDQHIRDLDKHLKSFDADVAKERQTLGLPAAGQLGAGADAGPSAGKSGPRKVRAKAAAAVASAAAAAAQAEAAPTSEELYQAALAVTDASEPTYCYCKRISFGEMICCDNDECPIEWFHFECVGLTPENRPKGKWYCNECRQTRK